jgi:hypothetical protein
MVNHRLPPKKAQIVNSKLGRKAMQWFRGQAKIGRVRRGKMK